MTFISLLIMMIFAPILLLVATGWLFWQPRGPGHSNPTVLLLLTIGLGVMVAQLYSGALRVPNPVINTQSGTTHEVVPAGASVGVSMLATWVMVVISFGAFCFGLAMANRWRNPSGNENTEAAFQKKLQSRAWIGFVPLLIAAALPVMQHFREQSRRAETATRLRALGESLHRSGIVTREVTSSSLPFPDFTSAVSALQPLNSVTTEPLPNWTHQSHSIVEGRERLVIVSQQYSTEAEAKADNDAQLREMGEHELREHWEPVFGGPRRVSFDANLPPFVVTESHVQTVQRDFGSFSAPMYRVWYQVQKPVNRADAWRISWDNEVKQSRVFLLGCIVGALLLLPVSILMVGQFSRMMGMQNSAWLLRFLIPAVAALWIAGAFWLNQSILLWPTATPTGGALHQPIDSVVKSQN